MKKIIIYLTILFLSYTLLNSLIQAFFIEHHGFILERPNTEIMKKTGYAIFESKDGNQIKVHPFLITDKHKGIYYQTSNISGVYTIDSETERMMRTNEDSIIIYSQNKTRIMNANDFINFGNIPDSICLISEIYYLKLNNITNFKKTYYSYNIGPIRELFK